MLRLCRCLIASAHKFLLFTSPKASRVLKILVQSAVILKADLHQHVALLRQTHDEDQQQTEKEINCYPLGMYDHCTERVAYVRRLMGYGRTKSQSP
jgi:hypothetical protein